MSFPGPISIVALNPVSCGSTVWRREGALQATIVVKATFGIVPDGPARLITPLPAVAEDTYASPAGSLVEPTDLAPYLPTAGVVLQAHAHAPSPVPAMTVRLAVFRECGGALPLPLVDKSLHVFGDRPPVAGAAPSPFREIPLVYERAYGGVGFPDNPVGTGAAADARASPNVVHPANPQQPAGFGPISKRWGPRRRLLGATDAELVQQHGSEIPAGLDWRYFHAAPADQQCDFFRGDEWIVLDGMHPTLPRVQTRLPSAQAQARWLPSGAGDPGQGLQVRLSADTLVIDAERRLCSLVWRGHVTVEHVATLARMVVFAGVDMPGYLVTWPDATPAKTREHFGDTQPASTSPLASVLPFRSSRPAEAMPKVAGSSPGAPPPSRPSEPAFDDVAEDTRILDAAQLEARRWERAAPFPLAEPGSRAPAPAVAFPGAPWSSPAAALERPVPGTETFVNLTSEPTAQARGSAAAVAEVDRAEPAPASGVRTIVVARLKAGEPLLDLDLAAADLHDLDLGGAILSRTDLKAARLTGCKLAGARLTGALLGDADLTGADLTGADLGHADLSGAVLARTRFDDAVLVDANLTGGRGPGASFAGAHAARASFARGEWDQASFVRAEAPGADFTAASVAGARFEGASLSEACFDDARGASAVFDGARLERTRAVGAAFPGASLRGVDATASVWERATLDEACFSAANLKQAKLARASCGKASFAGAELGGADLQRLTGDGADLREARLDGADLRQARLREAIFDRATLRDAAAGKADLARASFVRADLTGAVLRAARLTGASFAHATLEGTDLQDADLEGANVFGASRKTAKLGTGARGLIEVDPALSSPRS